MALVHKNTIINQQVTANITERGDSTEGGQKDFIGYLKISNYVSGSFTVTIEDSADGGENWNTYISFPLVNANGGTVQAPGVTRKPFASIRAVVVTAGGPDATVSVDLIYDKEGK